MATAAADTATDTPAKPLDTLLPEAPIVDSVARPVAKLALAAVTS